MPTCEICGREVPKLSRTKVEASVLEVCPGCAALGEAMPVPNIGAIRRPASHNPVPLNVGNQRFPNSQSVGSIDFSEFVATDFAKRVKDGRERQKLEFKTLAERLQVKEAFLHRVEQGRLVPDLALAKKIERALNIKIIERVDE